MRFLVPGIQYSTVEYCLRFQLSFSNFDIVRFVWDLFGISLYCHDSTLYNGYHMHNCMIPHDKVYTREL